MEQWFVVRMTFWPYGQESGLGVCMLKAEGWIGVIECLDVMTALEF